MNSKRDWSDKSHTPGPWVNNGGVIGPDNCTSAEAVCIVGTPNQQTPRNTNDARLIAAAPEILASLRVLMHDFERQSGEYARERAVQLRALLSRIDGQE